MRKLALLALCLLACCSPGKKVEETGYKIARDPDWYPLQLVGQAPGLTAFSDDIVAAVANEEGFSYTVVSSSYSLMQSQLRREQVDAILAAIPPIPEYRELYDFSDLYLCTGPVLIVDANSKIDSLDAMKGKTVGIQIGSQAMILVSKVPEIVIHDFMGGPAALQALERGEVDGIVMDALPAYAYLRDLYAGVLKVVTAPLDDQGLRLITMKGKNGNLIEMFNEGIHELVDDGAYDKLQKKWNLDLSEEAFPKKPLDD